MDTWVSRRKGESRVAIRRYNMRMDTLAKPEAIRNSDCAAMETWRPRIVWVRVRSQAWMFHPYS